MVTAQQNYSQYQQTRGGLAIPQASLLPIANGSDSYGLHPSLPEIQSLYNQGKAAVLANVGMLVQPITRTQYLTNNSAIVPSMLFSHSDQSNQWQTGIPAGNGNSGWGGRITDLLQSQNAGAIFPALTATAGCELFCTGVSTLPASVPPTGMSLLNTYSGSPSIASGFQQLLTFDNGVQLVQAANGIMTRGNTYANTLTGLIGGVTLQTVFPAGNLLASQLQTVATVMAVRSQLGLTRQIFFCFLDGFDTHGSQMETRGTAVATTEPGGAGLLPSHHRAGNR